MELYRHKESRRLALVARAYAACVLAAADGVTAPTSVEAGDYLIQGQFGWWPIAADTLAEKYDKIGG